MFKLPKKNNFESKINVLHFLMEIYLGSFKVVTRLQKPR